MFSAMRQALGRSFPLPVLRRWCLRAPSIDDVAVMMVAYSVCNVTCAIGQRPIDSNQAFSCALAGVRAMRMVSPMQRS
eukprot:8709160-Pyramimonas_sp.AAC.1